MLVLGVTAIAGWQRAAAVPDASLASAAGAPAAPAQIHVEMSEFAIEPGPR